MIKQFIVAVDHQQDGRRVAWLSITDKETGERMGVVLTESECQQLQLQFTTDQPDYLKIEY